MSVDDRCNGTAECLRGEDETGCDGCQDHQFQCQESGRCILHDWMCDGTNDCGDNSDEDPSLCQFRKGGNSRLLNHGETAFSNHHRYVRITHCYLSFYNLLLFEISFTKTKVSQLLKLRQNILFDCSMSILLRMHSLNYSSVYTNLLIRAQHVPANCYVYWDLIKRSLLFLIFQVTQSALNIRARTWSAYRSARFVMELRIVMTKAMKVEDVVSFLFTDRCWV